MNCRRCGRTLKNPTINGMGATCARKNHAGTELKKSQVHLIYRQFDRAAGSDHRRYLVITGDDRAVVSVRENSTGRFATCRRDDHNVENFLCEHIAAVAPVDRARFPEIKMESEKC